jgi:hypothetical protein
MQKCFVVLGLLCWVLTSAQQKPMTKILEVKDSIRIDSKSISPFDFELLSLKDKKIDSSWYSINYRKATIYPTKILKDSLKRIKVKYFPLPDFLTKSYSLYDPNIIINQQQNQDSYFDLVKTQKTDFSSPFQGLNTSGNISRAILVGNNQNAVTQSELDLQISLLR